MKIHYQCSNCEKKYVTSTIPGIPQGMYYSGCRAVGDAIYCEDCAKTWEQRNGEEFDSLQTVISLNVKFGTKPFETWSKI